ncbi:MAG: ATP-binding protein [Kiritimatiellaeota bacterium]|nr:ATP-binding protein [Kiritimatiellota bacterium]
MTQPTGQGGTTPELVRAWIARGEDRATEFKLRPTAARKMAVECAGLANSGGGRLLLGIRDDGEVAGCDISRSDIAELVGRIRALTEPPVPVQVEFCRIDGRRVVVLHIRGDISPPYEVDTAAGRRCPVRAGEHNMEASALMRRSLSRVAAAGGERRLPPRLRQLLQRQGRLTAPDYARCCNMSARRARRELVRLVREGRLTSYCDGPHEYFC